jgi:hypothetical protein
MEEFRDIKGYEGLYQISNLGRVKSIKNNIFLKQALNTSRYYIVCLSKKGKKKTSLIHRLIAQCFVSNKNNKPVINHINMIRTDNSISNLEWCTHSENVNHSYRNNNSSRPFLKGVKHFKCKLSEQEVYCIRYYKGKIPNVILSRLFKVSQQSITNIQHNRTWKHLL